jgi:hypothetical protein
MSVNCSQVLTFTCVNFSQVDAGILHNLYVKFKEEERPREGQGIRCKRRYSKKEKKKKKRKKNLKIRHQVQKKKLSVPIRECLGWVN